MKINVTYEIKIIIKKFHWGRGGTRRQFPFLGDFPRDIFLQGIFPGDVFAETLISLFCQELIEVVFCQKKDLFCDA